jgi:flagellar basal body-associated protein FliL
MKKIQMCLIHMGICFLMVLAGCGEKQKSQTDLAVGNWTQLRNRAYILLITNPKGEWNSSVRIADATQKIVSSKGTAKGTWHIEKNQMIFTVGESDIEEIWAKNTTIFYDIVELTDTVMQLKNESGRVVVWNKTNTQRADSTDKDVSITIPVGPLAVNLNKNRSSDKDRYLCLNVNLVLKEMMPAQEIPVVHPRARDAAILYLSSLVFNDVKDFDSIKEQMKKLVDVLNPYLEGVVKEITVEHVIVATEADKVDEFIIAHTQSEKPLPDAGEDGKKEPAQAPEASQN